MWKRVRIGILLVVLAIVAGNAWLDRQRAQSWRDSLYVGIFPIAADGRDATREYVATLDLAAFRELEQFFAREAGRYSLGLALPIRVELEPPPATAPPLMPDDSGPVGVAWWSLRMRWYAWRAAAATGRPPPHIRVFVLYHDPAVSARLPHSIGLSKGQIGVVNAFASASLAGPNAVVIAHEVLHTVGASDKYDPETDAPLYPQGFAEPDARPLYPQARTEIMAGRRALSASEQEMPESLAECVVGEATAAEIGWRRR
jgi:hypothetical protein